MLKLGRNLPQAGVAFLGLALLFTLPVNAHAGARSFAKGDAVAFAPASEDAVASPAVTVTSVQEFSSAGVGSVDTTPPIPTCTSVGLSCNPGDTCSCLVVKGNVTDGQGPLFTGPFTLYLVVNNSHFYPVGDNFKGCFFANGILSETPGSNATINFITGGQACNQIDNAAGLYSGGFTIGPSTGGFAGATGSGVIGLGFNTSFNPPLVVFDLKGAASNIN